MITIQDLISTTIGRRVRSMLNKSATTPIPNWDSNSPVDLPQPDLAPVMAMIRERVAAHAAEGSLDEAHGDLLDRTIHPICRQWAHDTRHAYEEQLRLWNYLEEQGTAHSIEKGQQLARLNVQLARYQAAEQRVWAMFDDDSDKSIVADAGAHGIDPLPAPPLPTATVLDPATPGIPVDPPVAAEDSDPDDDTPRIRSV